MPEYIAGAKSEVAAKEKDESIGDKEDNGRKLRGEDISAEEGNGRKPGGEDIRAEEDKLSEEEKRGYLLGDFKFFHLKDQKYMQFENHYHEFDKLIVFISGNVTYQIEGTAYRLKSWDILLVSNREIHRVTVEPGEPYERLIIYINHDFMEKHSSSDCDLSSCFETASGKMRNLLRLDSRRIENIKHILLQLEEACRSSEFGSRILQNAILIQLIVHVNRLFEDISDTEALEDVQYDENISRIIAYINANLGGDLSISTLADKFFISKYYLMHRFKEQTGYSVHSYILQKRLIMASTLLKEGRPVTDISLECGFGDHSSFVRAFKKMFGLSPDQYRKKFREMEQSRSRGHF